MYAAPGISVGAGCNAGEAVKRGSRGRISEIRWKRREMVHAILLAVVMVAFSVLLILWVNGHRFD
jgi:hypothetical protein